MNWVCITLERDKVVDKFFPSKIFPEAINARRITFKEAGNKDLKFWGDKAVIFHLTDREQHLWIPYYRDIINASKVAWLKFVCGVFMTDMTQLDIKKYGTPLSAYRMMYDVCKNMVWELPLDCNIFPRDVNKVPLTLYDTQYERPINGNKDIDFLVVMDDRLYYNYVKTLELTRLLSHRFNVKCILIKDAKQKFAMYHNKLPFETILNKKNIESQEKFWRLLDRSKVMLDLSLRWTYGRVVYEALFNGALAICPHTYGASYHLFPDLVVDTSNYSLDIVYDKCVKVISDWNIELVQLYRNRAKAVASPSIFAQTLNDTSERLLEAQ